jgi:hypothetical protein
MNRLQFLMIASLFAVSAGVWAEKGAKPTDIVVYRSPDCSCCGRWLEHLKQNNFNVQDIVTEDVQAIKNKHGVTPELASCHTALVDGHVIEGHVPAQDIIALLKSKPKDVGLAVPAMPVGTPGMEMGGKKDAYNVVSFDSKKHTGIFKSYAGAE